jgi:hypothetical protein
MLQNYSKFVTRNQNRLPAWFQGQEVKSIVNKYVTVQQIIQIIDQQIRLSTSPHAAKINWNILLLIFYIQSPYANIPTKMNITIANCLITKMNITIANCLITKMNITIANCLITKMNITIANCLITKMNITIANCLITKGEKFRHICVSAPTMLSVITSNKLPNKNSWSVKWKVHVILHNIRHLIRGCGAGIRKTLSQCDKRPNDIQCRLIWFQ